MTVINQTVSGGTTNGDILPAATGQNLGAVGQLWDLFAQSISATSLTLTGPFTIGTGAAVSPIVPRLFSVLDGSSSSYSTGITATTPSAYDSLFNGSVQTGAGFQGYTRRIDMSTESGIDVGSSAALGVFNNSRSTNSTSPAGYDATNQLGLVVNCSALATGSSASIFGENIVVTSLYNGALPQRLVGLEIDCSPTRDANADGGTTGPWSIGNLITNNSATGGTVDVTAGILVRGTNSTHGFKYNFLNGRLSGLAIGTENGITPDSGLWIRSATTWGVYVGSRAIESSAFFNSGMTLSNPSVGIELGELGATSANSNTLRFSARDGGSVQLAWDLIADSTSNLLFDFQGSPALVVTASAIKPGAVNTSDLGAAAFPFKSVYLGAAATNNIKVTGTATAARTLTLQDATGTVVPKVVAVDLTAQAAAITTTTLLAVGLAGQYRLVWDAKVTTVDGTSSTLGALTIVYTDPDGVNQTITAGALIAAGTVATSSAANTTSTVLLGLPITLNCKASTNITYAFGYVSNTPGQMKYNLHLALEQVG